jgi:hypothetical protein
MATSLDPNFEKNVFINCPFDKDFTKLLQPLLFTIIYLGFNPRIATERSDSGEQRIGKICALIKASKYSIHDLSRLQAKKSKEFYRLNMPFELGIDYGFRYLDGSGFEQKKFLILEKDRFDYAKALSDLSGVDIKSHNDEPINVIRAVRNWFTQFTSDNLDSPSIVWENFNYFMQEFFKSKMVEGRFSQDDIDNMPPNEFMSYIKEWLKQESS